MLKVMTDLSGSMRRVEFPLSGGTMAGIAFGDASRAPDLVFLHATGFNALTYRTMLAPLGERFHVMAVDLRGHGRSRLPARRFGYASWNRHRDDVIELLDNHLRAALTLAGHSMGATVGLLVAGARPDLVRGLALIDPVIMPPARYALHAAPGMSLVSRYSFPIARAAARRRSIFESKEDAVRALTGRGIFKSFSQAMLSDYVEDGTAEGQDGKVQLTCAPAYEAATFAAQRNDPWRALMNAHEPILVLRAQHGSTCPPPCAERMTDLRPNVRVATVEGATHALPMERPDRARAVIETAIIKSAPNNRFRDLV
jgi:pimeloyl-ACP methyl ester carboxylesterase